MRKTKRTVAVILGCVMLIGGTLITSAASRVAPYNSPCPKCHYNAGERQNDRNCLKCGQDSADYVCGRCGHSYRWCVNGHYGF